MAEQTKPVTVRAMKQARWQFRGWWFIWTIGRGGGIGINWHPHVQLSGFTIFLGPLILDVQPPLPEAFRITEGKGNG